jgi:hypothetical protein
MKPWNFHNRAQTGLYATDPALFMGKVDILYRMGLFTSVRETLDFLIKEILTSNPPKVIFSA